MTCSAGRGAAHGRFSRSCRLASSVLLAGVLAWAGPASSVVTGGGGGASKDCMSVYDAPINFPTSKPKHVSCVDGDPACDSDGVVDGICSIAVSVCANSSFNPSQCGPRTIDSITVDHAEDNGDRKFDPDFQAIQQAILGEIAFPTSASDQCINPIVVSVPIKGPLGNGKCRRGQKKVKLDTFSAIGAGGFDRDRDRIRLICEPASCDPQVLFTGTFDRIQQQVFNPNCALGGCHDSQGLAGGLLLEQGSAHGNLVGVMPSNGAANGAGWLRVTPSVIDTSYLHFKLSGKLDPGFGPRMPLDESRLPGYLRDIVDLWIEDGAPATGWTPGTF